MNASAFRDAIMITRDARAAGECNLRTLKASRVTIYYEMHERTCDFSLIFSINFSAKHLELFIEIFVLELLQFGIEFSFICPFFRRH